MRDWRGITARLLLASLLVGCFASPALADKKRRKKRERPETALAPASPEPEPEPAEAVAAPESPPPAAEPPVDDVTDREARALFKAGEAAFGEGRFEAAIEHFERAYELSHRPVLLLNIASAADRIRQDRVSLGALEQYLHDLPDAENRNQIETRIRVLRQQIAAHEAEEQRAASLPPAAPPVQFEPRPAPSAWPWVLAGMGVATAGAGGALLWLGVSAGKRVEGAEDGSSFDEVRDDYERSGRFPPIGLALLGAGGLCLASGAIWLIARDDEAPRTLSAGVGPAGVALRGSF
jgi:tetratricopeptide (TPR) repeat protein